MGHNLLLASVIITNMMPALGQIGAYFFDALMQSQVWINVQPQNVEPGPPPIELNISVCGENGWATDAIVTRIPFATFRRITSAADVELHALGFDTRLRSSDLQALQSFVTAVADGVTVR